MADKGLEDVIAELKAIFEKAGINIEEMQVREAEFDPLRANFDKALDGVRKTCLELVNDKVDSLLIISALVIHAVEFSYVQKKGYRGPARDFLNQLVDRAFDEVDAKNERTGAGPAMRKSFELFERGDKAAAMKIVNDFAVKS